MIVRLCIAVSCVVSVVGSAQATVIAMKRDAGLTQGGSIGTQFSALSDVDVVQTTVKDAQVRYDGNAQYQNWGTKPQATVATNMGVYGFDLSALSGATINAAKLRLRVGSGNSAMTWAAIKSHDWAEGNKNGGYPGASPAAPGVTWANPAGTNTTAPGPKGWGTNSDSSFSDASDGADLYTVTSFNSVPGGAAWCVADVTSIVQDWVNGSKPNYGLYVAAGNHSIYFSESGTANEPVLFVDYTPVPEPATLALLALGGLALIRRRTA